MILIYGGHLIGTGELTSGTLITFLLYMETLWGNLRVTVNIVNTSAPLTHTHTYRMKFLSFPFQTLVQWQGREFFKTLLKLETFFEYFERKSKLKTSGKETKEKLLGKLEFKGVSFKYPTRPDSEVLKVNYVYIKDVQDDEIKLYIVMRDNYSQVISHVA